MSQPAMEQPADGREVDPLEKARAVADAVLYEGYLLYPYRGSAGKNQSRWQFGVLGPQGAAAAGTGEEPAMVTECLVRHGPGTALTVRLRFLQLQARCVEKADGVDGGDGGEAFVAVADLRDVNGQRWLSWDEAIEHEVTVATVTLQDAGGESEYPVSIEGGEEVTQLLDGEDEVGGRLVLRRWPLTAVVRVSSSSVPEATGVSRLRIEVENTAASGEPHDKTQTVRRSFLGAHLLLTCDGGKFISMSDPPADLRAAAAACRQVRTWPVIAGPPGHDEVLLASQIILEDHPTLAAESSGSLFDSTEIDEILTLRILTMTEQEKAEARATDARAAEIIDRSERLSDDDLSQLHAMMCDPHTIVDALSGDAQPADTLPADTLPADTLSSETPRWDPECDASVDPATDTVLVAGTPVGRGSLVRLHPSRRADAQDLFFAGQIGRVTGVHVDVDGATHVAVVLVDDPVADLHDWYGRYLYFDPDELEPVDPTAVEAVEAMEAVDSAALEATGATGATESDEGREATS